MWPVVPARSPTRPRSTGSPSTCGRHPQVDWRLFEFTVDVAMLARHGRTGATPLVNDRGESPAVQVWLDPAGASPVGGQESAGVSRAGVGEPAGPRHRLTRPAVAASASGAGPVTGTGTDVLC